MSTTISGREQVHTHYHPATETWFTLGTCENCDGPVQEANSLSVRRDQMAKLRKLGVIISDTLPAEEIWPEDDGSYTCSGCHVDDE